MMALYFDLLIIGFDAFILCICANRYFNPLRPSGAKWRHRYESTLAQVMVCCLTAPTIIRHNDDFSSLKSSDIHLRPTSQEIANYGTKLSFKSSKGTDLKYNDIGHMFRTGVCYKPHPSDLGKNASNEYTTTDISIRNKSTKCHKHNVCDMSHVNISSARVYSQLGIHPIIGYWKAPIS